MPAFLSRVLEKANRATDSTGAADRDLRKRLNNLPAFLDGRRIDGTTIASAASSVITHGLGRTPKGWIVLDAESAPATLYRTAWGTTTITLYNDGTASCTVDLWVF